jgi:DNA-binding LacI/PurR family transcriptional regulator
MQRDQNARRKEMKRWRKSASENGTATLRTVADHVGLAPCSVSAILNNSRAADAIPSHTKERVLRAAKQLNYRPNLAARSLRTRRSYLVAIVASDLGNARTARILAGVEGFLREKGYLLVATTCDRTASSTCEEGAPQLLQRGIEGVISIDATLPKSLTLPLVFIDLPASDLPEPITPLKRERLLAMGETAAQSLLTQIEEKTGHLTRVSLTPEPNMGLVPLGIGVAVRRIDSMEHFAD